MARQGKGTTKRVTAADRAKKKQIADLEAKLRTEADEMNKLGARQNELEAELASVVTEIRRREGRCSMVAEQLVDLGVTKMQIELPKADEDGMRTEPEPKPK